MSLKQSLEYLASPAAIRSLEASPYWPKWDSPWWHMTLLWEMGRARDIPESALEAMVSAVNRACSREFPGDGGPDVPCHCMLGTLYQVLQAAGVDVDERLPWIRKWFPRYVLSDGGMSCDEDAYLEDGHPPRSSVVGTISPLEALLHAAPRPWSAPEEKFLDRGADFLIGRGLLRGSHEEEREDEADWLKPCFPRFYLYDALRGVRWLLSWAEERRKPIPRAAIAPVMSALVARFPDGKIFKERLSFEGVGTRIPAPGGEWARIPLAPRFGLLELMSALGAPSRELSLEWSLSRARFARLEAHGLITGT